MLQQNRADCPFNGVIYDTEIEGAVHIQFFEDEGWELCSKLCRGKYGRVNGSTREGECEVWSHRTFKNVAEGKATGVCFLMNKKTDITVDGPEFETVSGTRRCYPRE